MSNFLGFTPSFQPQLVSAAGPKTKTQGGDVGSKTSNSASKGGDVVSFTGGLFGSEVAAPVTSASAICKNISQKSLDDCRNEVSFVDFLASAPDLEALQSA